MNELIGTKAVDETTDPFNYLSLSANLPDSGALTLKVSAHGVRYPNHYRLTHDVVFTMTYDGNIYQLSGSEGSFNVKQEENKIILLVKDKEHCNAKVEHDPGPNYRRFVDAFMAMQEAVERTSDDAVQRD